MAYTLSQLQEKRALLQAALWSGALVVVHGSERTEYKSNKEMNQALSSLNAEIAALDGSTAKTRQLRIYPNRGI